MRAEVVLHLLVHLVHHAPKVRLLHCEGCIRHVAKVSQHFFVLVVVGGGVHFHPHGLVARVDRVIFMQLRDGVRGMKALEGVQAVVEDSDIVFRPTEIKNEAGNTSVHRGRFGKSLSQFISVRFVQRAAQEPFRWGLK